MLKEVLIDSFRSCDSTHIQDIGGMLVLLGRNGTGKTNILRAIEWAARSATSTEPFGIEPYNLNQVTLRVDLGSLSYKYTIAFGLVNNELPEKKTIVVDLFEETVSVKGSSNSDWEQLVARKNEQVNIGGTEVLKIGFTTPCIPALASLLPSGHAINQRLNPLRDFLVGVRYYPLDETNELSSSSHDAGSLVSRAVYGAWSSRLKTNGDGGDSVIMRILHMHFERKEQFRELISLLGKEGLGLVENIDIITYNQPNDNDSLDSNSRVIYGVVFKPADASTTFDFSDLSVGTRRVLRILVSMLFDGSTVLLMEHPEDAVHANLMRRLIGLLKTYTDPLQFILASHSSDVFNKLSPDEIRLVTMNKGLTALRPLNAEESEAAMNFVKRDGSLADFLESIEEC